MDTYGFGIAEGPFEPTYDKYGLYAKNKRRFKKQLNLILNNPKILNNINDKLSKQSENNSLALINNLVKKI